MATWASVGPAPEEEGWARGEQGHEEGRQVGHVLVRPASVAPGRAGKPSKPSPARGLQPIQKSGLVIYGLGTGGQPSAARKVRKPMSALSARAAIQWLAWLAGAETSRRGRKSRR